MKYTPHTKEDIKSMLEVIGAGSVDDLFCDLGDAKIKGKLNLPSGKNQMETERYMESLAAKNTVYKSVFMGAGSYCHYIPPLVGKLAEREEFLTAYTPYQAEMSQGILQAIFEYQTMIARLMGMEASNASLYDGSTAIADAVLMLGSKGKVLVSEGVNPNSLRVIKTYLKPIGIEVVTVKLDDNGLTSVENIEKNIDDETIAVVVASPNYYGVIEDTLAIGNYLSAKKAGYILSVNPIALALLLTPKEAGADIAVGEGQPLGLPMAFGGPYLGFMATSLKLARKMPGRIVGKTTDHEGRDAFVLTLQAREQHIRREKASSSICSNEAHCALTASIYLAAMGKEGLVNVASHCTTNAHYLKTQLEKLGFIAKYASEFFHEFVTVTPISADKIIAVAKDNGILAGLKLTDNEILWCATEMNDKADIDRLITVLEGIL